MTMDISPEPEHAGRGLHLGVPLYAYPTTATACWTRTARFPTALRFVVVNVASGAGDVIDPAYEEAIGALHAAGVRTIGYIDTDYGDRPLDDTILETRTWVTRYGVKGAFFDRVAGDFTHLDHYAKLSLGARANGAQFVVHNPGTDCHPAFADFANVIVTFEGTWEDYTAYEPSAWMLSAPASRFCHLVHTVPPSQIVHGPRLAAAKHATTSFFTDGWADNPYDRVPEALITTVRPRPEADGPPPRAASELWRERPVIPISTPASTAPSWGRHIAAGRGDRKSLWARLFRRPDTATEIPDVKPGILVMPAAMPERPHPAGNPSVPEESSPNARDPHGADTIALRVSAHDVLPTLRMRLDPRPMPESTLAMDP